MLPSEFKLFGNTINVKVVDTCSDSRYGYWNDATEEIVVATKVAIDRKLINLTEKQIDLCFLHELIHAFQWYAKGEYNEAEAQVYAQLLYDYLNTNE